MNSKCYNNRGQVRSEGQGGDSKTPVASVRESYPDGSGTQRNCATGLRLAGRDVGPPFRLPLNVSSLPAG